MIGRDIAEELRDIRSMLSLICAALDITTEKVAAYRSKRDLENEASRAVAKFKEKVHAKEAIRAKVVDRHNPGHEGEVSGAVLRYRSRSQRLLPKTPNQARGGKRGPHGTALPR